MKYIVEIAKEYEEYFKGILICGIAEGKFAVDVIVKEDLEELNSDYINEHYGSLQDEAYQRGLEDGKAVNDKGCEGCKWEGTGSDHSPCDYCCNCYSSQWTAKDDKIEVGDTVNIKDTSRSDGDGIVTKIWNNLLYIMWNDGSSGTWDKEEVVKTGRHFDIQSILEAMRND